jgi:FAD-dependent urate hydroxylase
MTSETPDERTALIVGAGIGGLAAALALRQAGWNVRVFEKARSPRELGFALLLAPNAMLALRSLGLEDVVIRGGVVVQRGEMRRANGNVLRRFDASRVSAALGAPTVCAPRPALHGALLDALGDDSLELASEVVGLAITEDAVSATFTDGRHASAAVLVGADGVGSTIRQLLHPTESPPRPSGLFALRGVAFDVGEHLNGLTGVQYFGRGLEAGLGRMGERAVYWYLSILSAEVARAGAGPVRLAAEMGKQFDDVVRTIVAKTLPEDMRLDELYEREPLQMWGRGRVTLLGDAAHPMLPHAGQGAAQALEDAVRLGGALATASSATDGLRQYEGARAARASRVVALARRNARVVSIRNPIGCWCRDVVIRLVPESVVAKSLIDVARDADR